MALVLDRTPVPPEPEKPSEVNPTQDTGLSSLLGATIVPGRELQRLFPYRLRSGVALVRQDQAELVTKAS